MAEIIGNANGERLIGTAFADLISGNGGNDVIFGLDESDIIFAGDDNDRAFGGDGDDRVSGGDGADRIGGGLGLDRLSGDNGADQFVFISGDTAADRVRDYEDGLDRLNVRAWDVTFDDLTFRETAAGHLVVRGDDAGERFVIFNTTRAQIDSGDFIGLL